MTEDDAEREAADASTTGERTRTASVDVEVADAADANDYIREVARDAGQVAGLVERRVNPDFPDNYVQGIWHAFWWASVTLTTVGYGDISPQTIPGQFLASLVMIMGYGVIAEGVETAEQEAFLAAQDCREVQGYYHSQPLSAGDAERFLRARAANPARIADTRTGSASAA